MRPLRHLSVSVSALEQNIAREAASAPVLVDVSADAFGLGMARVASAVRSAGALGLFAATADDALAARRLDADADIVVGRAAPDRRSELDDARIIVHGTIEAAVARDSIYGFDGRSAPTVSLHTEVLSTKAIRSGDGVSYGYTYRASRDERTALAALGYGDGVHRHAGNRCAALVDGEFVPIVGRVAMNVLVVSLGDRSVDPGAPVVLFGDPARGETGLSEWAGLLGVHPAAVVAGIGVRVERVDA